MTREEILQAFDDINFVYNDCTRYDTLKRMLEELTERKRGEWVLNDDQVYECKDCGYVPSLDGYTYFNYCPNCGADMRGEHHD